MDIKDLETIHENYEDFRFGVINVYMNPSDRKLYMSKRTSSQTIEDHQVAANQSLERKRINHPHILEMIDVNMDDVKLTVDVYFEYPNEDLYQREDELRNPQELLKLLHDIIQAMSYLQSLRLVHGDIRPEYIYYNEEKDSYVLLDRLGNTNAPNQAQMSNISNQENLYMSPILFNSLTHGTTDVEHNPFKSEIFALGMVVLSLLTDEEELQKVYDMLNKRFNTRLFTALINNAKDEVFYGGAYRLIGEFMLFCMLTLNVKERLTPRRALKVILNKFKAILNSRKGTLRESGDQPHDHKIISDNYNFRKSKNKPLYETMDNTLIQQPVKGGSEEEFEVRQKFMSNMHIDSGDENTQGDMQLRASSTKKNDLNTSELQSKIMESGLQDSQLQRKSKHGTSDMPIMYNESRRRTSELRSSKINLRNQLSTNGESQFKEDQQDEGIEAKKKNSAVIKETIDEYDAVEQKKSDNDWTADHKHERNGKYDDPTDQNLKKPSTDGQDLNHRQDKLGTKNAEVQFNATTSSELRHRRSMATSTHLDRTDVGTQLDLVNQFESEAPGIINSTKQFGRVAIPKDSVPSQRESSRSISRRYKISTSYTPLKLQSRIVGYSVSRSPDISPRNGKAISFSKNEQPNTKSTRNARDNAMYEKIGIEFVNHYNPLREDIRKKKPQASNANSNKYINIKPQSRRQIQTNGPNAFNNILPIKSRPEADQRSFRRINNVSVRNNFNGKFQSKTPRETYQNTLDTVEPKNQRYSATNQRDLVLKRIDDGVNIYRYKEELNK